MNSISIGWLDRTESAISIRYDGQWSWADFYQTINMTKTLITSHPDRLIHTIHDFRKGSCAPSEVDLIYSKAMWRKVPKNAGMTIIVAPTAQDHRHLEPLKRLLLAHPLKVAFVTSPEMALLLLEHMVMNDEPQPDHRENITLVSPVLQ
jgi:hypothetical protein